MRVLNVSGKNTDALSFSPDGRILAVGGSGLLLEMWEPSGGIVAKYRVSGRVFRFAFHPRLPIAFAVIGKSLWRFNYTRPTTVYVISPLTDRFALSPAGDRLVVSGRFDLSLNGNRFRMFDVVGEGTIVSRWQDPPEGAGNLHWGLTWLSGPERFAVAEWVGDYPNQSAIITLRDSATGGVIETCDRSGLPSDDLAASHAGQLVARAKATLSVWQGSHFALPPRVIHNDGRKHFTGIAFHPSGKFLAATSNDATVKLYDTTTWEVARTFTWDIGKMQSIAFSPDGTLAAAGSDKGKVVVWDVDV